MPTQNILFTSPNDEWLEAQVDNEKYTNRSEIVNALIQKARETDSIRMHLIQAEQSGFTQQTRAQILTEIKNEAKRNGQL
ncbi:MAG: antitoxin ParD1/3/4 [Phenylobacterium sp.]|jgi:antitoxin ParD1/3/4